MKKVTIKQFTHAEVDSKKETFGFLKIPAEHKLIRAEGENLEVSDGYHTFEELYEHRNTLFIEFCKRILQIDLYRRVVPHLQNKVWRSKLHADGSSFNGWFILGVNEEPGKQVSYHLPMSKWKDTDFVMTLKKAPKWDGHTSGDVLKRLKPL